MKKTSLLLLVFIGLPVSCKKDQNNPSNFYIRMDINGKHWQSMHPYTGARVQYEEGTGGFYSQMRGQSDVEIDGRSYEVDFSLPFAFKKGRFELGKIYDDGHSASAANISGVTITNGQAKSYVDTGIGYIEITDFKKGEFVTGTFACKAKIEGGPQIVINNGVFRCALSGGYMWNPE